MELKPLDIVYITSTKGVSYLSAPSGQDVTPKGLWTVATLIDDKALITKGDVVVLIPISDVLKAQDSHLDAIMDFLKGKENVKGPGQGKTQGHQ